MAGVSALEYSAAGWVVLVLAALVVGIAKTSIGGVGVLAVAAFAMVIPARESTAAVLLLLIIGDLIAVLSYRRSADWSILRRLLPAVLPGIVLGALVIKVIDDRTMTLVIALCLIAALTLQWALRRRPSDRPVGKPHPVTTLGTGAAAGFTTMIANAAGPVMALYLLAARVDKVRFLGTNAWFFLLVNVSKVPFAAGLGLLPASTLWLTLVLTPAVVIGTVLGRRLLRVLGQQLFERLTLGAAFLAAALLLVQTWL